MATLAAFLLLWGLSLSPAAEGGVFVETRPDLWAEAGSLQEPWAKLTLVCRACLVTSDFQLFKDGELLERVRLSEGGLEHRFPLGAVTGDTRGLYRCRYAMGDDRWTSLSNLLEVTGADTLPAPVLSSKPVSWISPGLTPTLLCRAGLAGVTFLLRLQGDDQFLEVAEAPGAVEATFPVHRAGNYSCTYRTHEAGAPSEPSATVTIEDMPRPPPPRLSVEPESGESAAVLFQLSPQVSLRCVAPVQGVEFQLRRGDRELRVTSWGTTPGTINFQLKSLKPADSGLYTCRYQLRREDTPWSLDSAPVELLLSDETLPAPELSAQSVTPFSEPGARVKLQCRAPRAGQRFALVQEDAGGRRRVRGLQSPEGKEARFELRDMSPMDSSNYSCVYMDPARPGGSKPSARLELRVDGPLPKPRLRPLWSGKVSPGRDAVLRCETPVAHQSLELLAAGEVVASAYGPSEDLVLTYVGPQHAGKYSCRYRSRWPLVSELSDPVELQVAER